MEATTLVLSRVLEDPMNVRASGHVTLFPLNVGPIYQIFISNHVIPMRNSTEVLNDIPRSAILAQEPLPS